MVVCSTCGGTREIDQRLGGDALSGMVPCPDCSHIEMAKQKYVLGFMYLMDGESVLLIKKSATENAVKLGLAGKLNGIGGRVIVGEDSMEAMIREFREETGLHTRAGQWRFAGELEGDEFLVDVYVGTDEQLERLRYVTEEGTVADYAVWSMRSWNDLADTLPVLLRLTSPDNPTPFQHFYLRV